ncbi:MAG: hypothetical protein U5L96_21045 [Owenweeksia sp.]|nr:hypothetical protein [Owenweeksia sp.]
MVLAGHMDPSPALGTALRSLQRKSPFLLVSETVSNLPIADNIRTIDRLLNTLDKEAKEHLRPDLLITIGGELVSKMIKQFVKDYPLSNIGNSQKQASCRIAFSAWMVLYTAGGSIFLTSCRICLLLAQQPTVING